MTDNEAAILYARLALKTAAVQGIAALAAQERGDHYEARAMLNQIVESATEAREILSNMVGLAT